MRKVNDFFSIDGVSLEYLWLGPGPDEAPVLVFLHEGLGCVEMWKDFPERAAEATGWGALAFSRAGYGKSDPCALPRPLGFMHIEGLVTLPRVLDAAGIRRAVLVGHSDGASIALINAGGLRDERILGLVLMAPHVLVEPVTVESIRAAGEAYEKTDLRQRLSRYHGDNVDCAFLGWNRAWLHPLFLSWNLEIFLPGIEVPVLLIQGEEDNYGTALQLETIERGLPAPPEVRLLKGCGHSPFRDQPEMTLEALTGFVSGWNASRGKALP
jgi:pimeloyl-ACP methyl ester carboxylesterase